MLLPPYTYRAVIVRVIDGDTFIADVDLGFGLWLHGQSFRLLGVNAREHDEPGGEQARDNLAAVLGLSKVLLTSVKPDKYGGRYDALVTLEDGSDLSVRLVRTQWASIWNGTGVKPVPPWPRSI